MKYYIYVKGEKIYISEDLYKSYWQLVNHEKYLRRKDKINGLVLFSAIEKGEFNFEEQLPDNHVDVEKLVETKLMIEQLNKALLTLSDKEFDIIKALYFEDYSIRQVADQQEMSPTSLFRLRNRILTYLKNILDK